MARDIRERPCDFCPSDCRFMTLEVDTHYLYSGNEVVSVSNVMTCVHENICSMWNSRDICQLEPETDAPKEYVIDRITKEDIQVRCISAGSAEYLLDRLRDFVEDYGEVSVADLYDLVGAGYGLQDNKYGWKNLDVVNVLSDNDIDFATMRKNATILINLPKTIRL